MQEINCKICEKVLNYAWTKNPNLVCTSCEKRAVDASHQPVVVTRQIKKNAENVMELGELVAFNKDSKEFDTETASINRRTTRNRFCFIDGIAVEFYEEGSFSGLVVSENQADLKAKSESSSETQPCGICKNPVGANQRYPHYVCFRCQDRAVDSLHRPVTTSNTGILGTGEIAYLREKPEGSDEHEPSEPANENNEIYIDGVKCTFEEARFGGIVVQVAGKERRPINFEF